MILRVFPTYKYIGIFISLCSFLIERNVSAQTDSLLMLNGKVFVGEITASGNGSVTQSVLIRKDKIKTKQFAEYRVFATYKAGVERICYVQDDFLGNFLTIPEARSATFGSYDARKVVKPRFAFWSSFALGLGVSLIDTYLSQNEVDNPKTDYTNPGFFQHDPTIVHFFGPPILMAVWAIPKTKVKLKNMIHPQFHGDENYFRGYHRVARQKRMLAALRGTAFGALSGLLAYSVGQCVN